MAENPLKIYTCKIVGKSNCPHKGKVTVIESESGKKEFIFTSGNSINEFNSICDSCNFFV